MYKRTLSSLLFLTCFCSPIVHGATPDVSLSASADIVKSGVIIVTVPPEVSLSSPADRRAVVGQTLTHDFGVSNLSATETTFDIGYSLPDSSAASGSLVSLTQGDGLGATTTTDAPGTNPWVGATLGGSHSGSIRTSTNLGSSLAGDVVAVTTTASSIWWDSSPTVSTNVNVVQNRQLTGATTIDAGRHMVGQNVGSLTLNGGSLGDTQATRVNIHSGGNAQFSNGLRLTSDSDFVFNAADQTHDLQVAYNGPVGAYTINTTLPGAGASTYTDVSGAERQEFGGSWQATAEYGNIFGEKRELSQGAGNILWFDRSSNRYIYVNEQVETAQPEFDAERTTFDGDISSDWELARGAGALVNERVDPLVTGEVIEGSSLDLSGASVNVTGTAVWNRQLGNRDAGFEPFDAESKEGGRGHRIDLGRRMVGASEVAVNRTDSATIETSGSHEERTDLTLNAFNESSGDGLDAELATAVVFNEAGDTATVNLTADFVLNTDAAGRFVRAVDVGGYIDGEGLAGEDVQSNLAVGYQWANVLDNELFADNLLVIENAGKTGTRTYFTDAGRVYHAFDPSENPDGALYTAIGKTGHGITITNSFSAGETDLGNHTVSAVAEGLAGETVADDVTFNAKVVALAAANHDVSHTATGDTLDDGDVITIQDTGNGIYQNNTRISAAAIAGSESIDYELISGVGNAIINHGDSREFTIDYIGNDSPVVEGELGRVAKATLDLFLRDSVNFDEITSGFTGDVDGLESFSDFDYNESTISFNLETRFDAPAATTGESSVAAGSNFGVAGLTLNNTSGNTSERFETPTGAELLDSKTLNEATTVSISFVNLAEATVESVDALEDNTKNSASAAGMLGGSSESSAFVSDVVQLSGLNDVLHVLEISYNETELEFASQLIWSTTFDNTANGGAADEIAWVNAVLGNSNIENLDLLAGFLTIGSENMSIEDYLASMRFEGSYTDYLSESDLTDPVLGAWGIDQLENRAWAVIDHNSDFAVAVPEPAVFGFIAGMLMLGYAGVRRRR